MINKTLLPVVFFILFLSTQYSFSKSLKENDNSKKEHSQKMLELFDGICMQNTEDFSNIDRMVKIMKFKKVPDLHKAADPAFRSNSGSMYGGLYEGAMFLVGYINNGGCTVASKNFNAKSLIKKISNNYKVKSLDKIEEGVQIQEFFSFKKHSLYEGGVISIVYGKDDFDSSVGSVGYLPHKAILKNKDVP
jgi:hypothetical protein